MFFKIITPKTRVGGMDPMDFEVNQPGEFVMVKGTGEKLDDMC